MAVVVSTGVLKLSAKRMVWPATVSLNTTLVPVVTALLNVAPLLLVKVKVLSEVVCPTAPVTLTVPVVPAFKLSDSVLAVLPLTEPPKVKLPPAVWRATSAVSVSAVSLSPKLMAALVVPKVPAVLMAAGAVAVRPPAKVNVSPTALPNTKLPVFKNVVAVLAALTFVAAPSNSRW